MATTLFYPLTGIMVSLVFGAAAGIFSLYLALIHKETNAEEKKRGIALAIGMIMFFSVLFYIVILDHRTIVTDYNRDTGVYPHYIETVEAWVIALIFGTISASISYLMMRLINKNFSRTRSHNFTSKTTTTKI